MSTLQKFIHELQGTLQTDLSHLKEFVKDELADRMVDASEIVEKINSCVAVMHKQMVMEKVSFFNAMLLCRKIVIVINNCLHYFRKVFVKNCKFF